MGKSIPCDRAFTLSQFQPYHEWQQEQDLEKEAEMKKIKERGLRSKDIGDGSTNKVVSQSHRRLEGETTFNRQSISRQSSTRFDSQSITSRPREITCNIDITVESIPFSIDGMEKAKWKIKSQAAKIRELEVKLERAVSNSSCDHEDNGSKEF